MEEAIQVWTSLLKHQNRDDELEDDREANILPEIQPIPLEIRIVSQYITVVPTLEKARSSLFAQLFAWHGIITEQPRISSTRFQVISQLPLLFNILFKAIQQTQEALTYKAVLLKMPKKEQMLVEAYNFLKNQAIWDLQQDILFERLGTDLSKWMEVMNYFVKYTIILVLFRL